MRLPLLLKVGRDVDIHKRRFGRRPPGAYLKFAGYCSAICLKESITANFFLCVSRINTFSGRVHIPKYHLFRRRSRSAFAGNQSVFKVTLAWLLDFAAQV